MAKSNGGPTSKGLCQSSLFEKERASWPEIGPKILNPTNLATCVAKPQNSEFDLNSFSFVSNIEEN